MEVGPWLRSVNMGRLAGICFIDGGTGIERKDGTVSKIGLEDD